jgi:putative nucleotidyltransferase with HDIG domain
MSEIEIEAMRILFVDDEPRVLDGLRRMLRTSREQWHMRFCDGPLRALEALQEEPFDVVVTDMRMPVMDGAELLSRIRDQYPQTIRIVLSGQSEQERVLRAVGPAHQYLSKPCNPDELRSTILKASLLGRRLENTGLKSLVSKLSVLPSLPKLYVELVEELAKEDCSVSKIGSLISQDVGMTAKLLQVVNSSFFGLPVHVVDLKHAVSLLGTNTIRQLVMAAGVFRQATGASDKQAFLRQLFDHSMAVGSVAKSLATDAGLPKESVDNAFLAGVLHDVGKLVLVDNFDSEYTNILLQSQYRDCPTGDLEVENYGSSHADIGGYLLGLWGLPQEIIEAVAFHHDPASGLCDSFTPLTAVHIADAFCHEQTEDSPDQLDWAYIRRLQIEDRLESWRSRAPKCVGIITPGAPV